MTIPAYIYARYSSLEQGRGHSLERQIGDAREYIKRKGWLHDPEREITDKGRSAYSGANRAAGGELWEFERRVEKGLYRNGAVLVVEHLDRISRQGFDPIYEFLKLMTRNGVAVAFMDTDTIYPANEPVDPNKLYMLIGHAEGSKNESVKKSKRLKAVQAKKIERIQAGERKGITGLPPGWMDRYPETLEISLNKHRTAVLNEIFDLYLDGYGLPSIVGILNARGEPTWGVKKKNKDGGWNTAYLSKLLKSRAVLGEHEFVHRSHGDWVEVSTGVRVTDRYPQAVSTEKFNKVAARRKKRLGTGGPGEALQSNLFSGSAFCTCGAAMYFQSKQRAGRPTKWKSRVTGEHHTFIAKTDIGYLQCNDNRRKHRCTNGKKFRYERLEEAVIEAVLGVAMDDKKFRLSDKADELRASIAERERMIEGKRHNLQAIVDGLAVRFIQALAVKAGEIEDEINSEEAEVQSLRDELDREHGQGSPEMLIERVREVQASLHSEDKDARYAARVRVKQALSAVMRMECSPDGIATVQMLKGAMRWAFDRQGNLIEHIDHLDEQPVTITQERD